jgi:hypothetical protein
MPQSEDAYVRISGLMKIIRSLKVNSATPLISPNLKISLGIFKHFIGVLVPSRDSSDNLLPVWQTKYAIKLAEVYFFMLNDGSTSVPHGKIPARGMYLSNYGKAVRENSTLVFSFVKKIYPDSLSGIMQFASSLRGVLKQETIALFIDDGLILIGKASLTLTVKKQ